MARSLRNCLKKAEKIIDRDDRAAVLELAEAGTEAGATRQLYRRILNEKQELLDQIEAAGGNPEDWIERLEESEVDFNDELNDAGKAIEREFFEWLNARDWDEIKLMYASMSKDNGYSEDTHNGKTLNADAFRDLFDKYRRDRLLADPAHEPSSAGIKKLLYRYIDEAREGDLWFFTAGGPASGKGQTQGLSAMYEDADMIFDGTMSNFDKDDRNKISKLVKKGVRVHISFNYMNPFTAFVGSLQRAMDMKAETGSGRAVNKEVFIGGSVGANVAIRQMYEKYKNNPLVTFDFFYNERIVDEDGKFLRVEPHEVTLDEIPQLSRADLTAMINEYVGELHATGEIDEEIFQHTINSPWRRKGGKTEADSTAKFERELLESYAQDQQVPEAQRYSDQGRETTRVTEGREEPAVAYSRSPEAQANYARMRMALAVPIRQLTGTLNVSLLATADEVPADARPADDPSGNTIEGLWIRGTNEAFLVADNMSVERAQRVLAHEAFGHYAMEQMPEFTKILDSIQNLKSIGNKTITAIADRVARTQGNLDSVTEAKEILATMAETGVKSTTMDMAVAAVRGALRRIFGVDLDYNEAEIRQLLVEGARGLQSNARAQRAAIAAKPLARQILENPEAVEAEIRNAIEEIYAKSVLQDTMAGLYEELQSAQDPTQSARADRIRAAIEQIELAPAAAADVLYQTAYHGTGAPEFDRFDLKYIGSGEGVQAYGWGLYFSDLKGVADWYRQKLGRRETFGIAGIEGDRETFYKEIRGQIAERVDDPGPVVAIIENVASAATGMVARHKGKGVEAELRQQAKNRRMEAENLRAEGAYLGEGVEDAERTEVLAKGVEDAARIWDIAADVVRDNPVTWKMAGEGTIFKVDVPEDDDLLDWRKKLSAHSQKVQDKIKARFPELFEEQYLDHHGIPGGPIDDSAKFTNFFMVKGRAVDRMYGDTFYQWVHDHVVGDSPLNEGNVYHHRRWERTRLQRTSELLRNELGIPGHIYQGWTSKEKDYVIYDDGKVTILDSAPHADFLFSRAQPFLKLDPKEMGGQPDPTAVAAKKLPPGESSKFYWQIAVGAQVQAVKYARSSWERRYYDELGRLAAEAAGEARRMSVNLTEQLALFSRGPSTRMTLNRARTFALGAHASQTDYDGIPYFPHANRVGLAGRTLNEKVAGYLHDIIEDAGITPDELRQHFPDVVVDAVEALTWREAEGESYDDYMDRVLSNPLAAAVKFYDTRDNMRLSGVDRLTGKPVPNAREMRDRTYEAMKKAWMAMDGKKPPLMDRETYELDRERALQQRIQYSRGRVFGDDEIEAIRAHVLPPANEDITLKDRMRAVVNNLFGIDWLRIKQGIVDSAASLEALERRLNGGGLMDASVSAYKAYLSTKNLGSVMAAVMHRGVPVLREGVFQPRRGRKGLVEIFTPITQHADGNLLPLWELYAVARRSDRLIGEKNPDGTSKEKRMTRAQIDKALTLGQQYPEFETAFLEWNKFNQQVLDLAVKTGVINQEERKIWAKNDYVPFYRAMEDMELLEGPQPRGRGVEGVRSGIRRLTGRDAQIGHVFENMVMNTAYLIDASFKNDAMQRIVMLADGIAMEKIPMAWEAIRISDGDMARALTKAGLLVVNGETESDMFNDALLQVRAMTPEQKEHWSKVFRRVAPTGPDVVSVLINGKPVYYRVDDPLLLRTIQSTGGIHQFHAMLGPFRGAKRLLTSAVTIDPAFMLANFVRDTLSSWVVADTGGAVPPILEALKGAKAAFNEDEDTLKIMMAGAGGGGFYDHNPEDVRKMLAKKLPQGQVDSFMNSIITPRGAWRFWQKIGNAAEQANRVAKYRKILAEGGTAAEAAYAARDILNFSMSGDFAAMQILTQTVPFLNARIQGLYRLYRGYGENPIGFFYKGATIVGATLALLLKNMDDERYDELPEWDKDTYWHFFIGDEHFRLPKPFEVGAMFGTVPERAVRLMAGRDDWELFGKRIIKMFGETLQFNPTPQLVKPLIEQWANRSMFTGAPLVGFTLSNLEPEAQYDHWTSETMREWADAMPDFAPEWLRSPKRLEAAVRGYTGALGMYVLGASDAVTRRALGHPDRPTKALQDYPVVTRFWRNPQPNTSKYTTQLYDMMNEADALYRTLNVYQAQGRLEDIQDLLEGQRGKLAARKFLHAVSQQVREINNQMKIVVYSDMDPDEKKAAMDKLNAAKMQAVRQVAHVAELF